MSTSTNPASRDPVIAMSVTDNDDSEGNIQLWQAPQQDAHSLQTLRLVLNPRETKKRVDGRWHERTSIDVGIAQVVALFTSKSTHAPHADTQLLRPGNVRPKPSL
jgi:hypothetical protein